jgi:hypothetical protein
MLYMLSIQNFEENISVPLFVILLYCDSFDISSLMSKYTIISYIIHIVDIIMTYNSIRTVKNKTRLSIN